MNDPTLILDPSDLRPLHGVRPQKHRATDLDATLAELEAGSLPLPIVSEDADVPGTYESVTLDRVRAAGIRAHLTTITVRARPDLSVDHLRSVEVHYADLIADPYVRPIERIRCTVDLLAYVLLWDSEAPELLADAGERMRVATRTLLSHRTHRRGRPTAACELLGLEPAAVARLVEHVVTTHAHMTPQAFAAHRPPLLEAPQQVKAALTSGQITLAQAEQLTRLPNEEAAARLRTGRVPSSRTLAAKSGSASSRPRVNGPSQQSLEGHGADCVTAAQFLQRLPPLTANERRKVVRIVGELLELRSRYSK